MASESNPHGAVASARHDEIDRWVEGDAIHSAVDGAMRDVRHNESHSVEEGT